MKPLNFVFFDTVLENFGIEILSSVLKINGYNVFTIIEPSDSNNFSIENYNEYRINRAVMKIMECQPDVVGFSAFTETYQVYRRIAEKIKKINNKIIILFGGVHTTLVKDAVLNDEFVDFAIIGEAEEALIEFLEELRNNKDYKKIRNLCYREGSHIRVNPCRPYIRDLDSLPFMDKSAYLKENVYLRKRYSTIATRGCFWRCTFCSNNALHEIYSFEKNHVRFRSPENVIQELLEAKRKHDYDSVFFIDDIFTFNRDWLQRFSGLYKKNINLPLDCRSHPNFVTQEIADLLKEINTKQVSIGIQTADENLRKIVLKRHETNEQVAKAIKILNDHKIKVVLDHISCLPGETFKTIEYSIECYSRWGPTDVSARWLAYYPNTEIVGIAKEKGILSAKDVDDIAQGRYSDNYNTLPRFSNKKDREKYIKYHILMASIGVLPGWLIRFLVKRLYLVLPFNVIATALKMFSRLVLHRQLWTFNYFNLVIKNKVKLLFIPRKT